MSRINQKLKDRAASYPSSGTIVFSKNGIGYGEIKESRNVLSHMSDLTVQLDYRKISLERK